MSLNAQQEQLCTENKTDFSDLKAVTVGEFDTGAMANKAFTNTDPLRMDPVRSE